MRLRGTAGRGRGRAGTPGIPILVLGLALAAIAAACGPSRPSLPGLPTASPAAEATPPVDASGQPRPTPWTGNAALGIEALALADSQITAAMADLGRGIAEEDLAVIRSAAGGLAGLDVLLPNMDKIRPFEPMAPFADQYETAITTIDAAAQAVVDAIDAGDGPAITSSTETLVDSLALYTAVQPQLATYVEALPDQKRMLLR